MSVRWMALPLALLATLLGGSRPVVAGDPDSKVQDQGPTPDQLYLRVESLVGNVADLDVRRFTILAPAGKKLKFYIGESGVETRGDRAPGDKADVRRLEVIVMLRLDPREGKLVRLMKFSRRVGSLAETAFDAPGLDTLAGVVALKARSVRYPIGKPVEVGTVQGEKLVVTVE